MKKLSSAGRLRLTKETLSSVGGGAWHRTSLRCHESYVQSCQPTQCTNCSNSQIYTCGGTGCGTDLSDCGTCVGC